MCLLHLLIVFLVCNLNNSLNDFFLVFKSKYFSEIPHYAQIIVIDFLIQALLLVS